MGANLEKQKELDAEIARLQLELLELKRARNELSPISQLPTDVMTIIFCFSLSTQSLRQGWGSRRLPDYVELCHVSRAWREIALNTPRLWALMQIRAKTKIELLQSQIIHSKHAPLTMEYYWEEPKAELDTDGVSAIISSVAPQRLRSLKILAQDDNVVKLIKGADACAEELEELVIRDVAPHRSFNGGYLRESIFAGQTPNLRRLELSHYILPWTSSILTSTNLSDLQMGSLYHGRACGMDRQYIMQCLTFLRHTTQLKKLTLHLSGNGLLENEIADVAEWAPVDLPSLESLKIITTEPTPLMVLVPLLLLDARIKHVLLNTAAVNGTPEIAAMLSGFKRASCQLSAPQQVRIRHCRNQRYNREFYSVNLEGWRSATVSSGIRLDAGPFISSVPWVNLKARPQTMVDLEMHRFPLANPANLDLEWWFSDVHTLIIDNMEVTSAFWDMLSSRPKLRFLSVALPGRGDVNLLLYDTLCGKGMDTHDSQGNFTAVPFPALRALHFICQNVEERETQLAIATSTLGALKRRKFAFEGQVLGDHPLDLEEISFVNCATTVEREVLNDFLDVTEKVTWREKARKGADLTPGPLEIVRS